VIAWGRRWAFILTGLLGFIWLVLWFFLYDIPSKHKKNSTEEYVYINSDELHTDGVLKTPKLTWVQLLGFRQIWAFTSGKFLTDPVWWFYLFWLPDFLVKQYGLKNTALALPIALAYTMATAGRVFGGWLPMYFIRQGWLVFRARKTAMLIYACAATPVLFTQYLGGYSMWLAVATIGLAMAAHQAWSANMYTTVSDSFKKSETGSVTGIGSMFGALGGILIAISAGHLFDYFKARHQIETGYFIMFSVCSLVYLTAWIAIQILNSVKKKIDF